MSGNCDWSSEETEVVIQEDVGETIPLTLDGKFFSIKEQNSGSTRVSEECKSCLRTTKEV
jgi:hypothetical protein